MSIRALSPTLCTHKSLQQTWSTPSLQIRPLQSAKPRLLSSHRFIGAKSSWFVSKPELAGLEPNRGQGVQIFASNAEREKTGVSAKGSQALDTVLKGASIVGEMTPEAQQKVVTAQTITDQDKESAYTTVAVWAFAAIVFGSGIGYFEDATRATEFFAGYLLELSLSVDNLFVFVLVFSFFKVPQQYQSKVLSYGIGGAVVFRALMILAGIAALEAFEAVNLIFAAILLYSCFKLLTEGEDDDDDLSQNSVVKFCKQIIPVSDSYDGDNFYTLKDGVKMATPLFLSLAVIEISDVVFALDSIPAIFGVTTDPFIVFTSNIFAILGLRSLYTVLSTGIADLRFLQPAIAIVLGFIGSKMIGDYFGYHISTEASLGVVASLLSGGVFLSLRFPRETDIDA